MLRFLTCAFYCLFLLACTNANPQAYLQSLGSSKGNSISVSDQTFDEYGIASVKVSLSSPSTKDVSFNYYTQNDTAISGSDYLGITTSSATIPAGKTEIYLPVSLASNYTKNSNQQFLFGIKDVINAAISKASSLIKIQDDDYDKILNVTQVTRGDSHACLLTAAGGVKCWGSNVFGQLGNGTTVDSSIPTDVSGFTSGVAKIIAGDFHNCAIKTDQTMHCWGFNSIGQLGDGTTVDKLTPAAVIGLAVSSVTDMAAGFNFSCALLTSGIVQCWGQNTNGQLGNGTFTNSLAPVNVSGLTGITGIGSGGYHACAITSTGSLKCWGRGLEGQLGNGATSNSNTPVPVTGILSGATSVDGGDYFTCAIVSGAAKCWGQNVLGQVGDGTTTNPRSSPVATTGLTSSVTSISSGKNHTCAVKSNIGYCWGNGSSYQLGNGNNIFITTPTAVTGLGAVVSQASSGAANSCMLLLDTSLKCWGNNLSGEIGDAGKSYRAFPVDVNGLSLSASLIHGDIGDHHSCIVQSDGIVKCWGENTFGQLGDGTTLNKYSATVVVGISNASKISAGDFHTCAVTTSGAGYCWGYNNFGQLGDGTTTNHTSANAIPSLASGVRQIVSGVGFSCSLDTSGAVKCWGTNSLGQLGDGTTIQRNTPTSVFGLSSGVSSITAGSAHACALMNDNSVRCWGYNLYGQLGNSTNADSLTPVTVAGLSDATGEIVTGQFHTCVNTTSQIPKCWGNNVDGQLGDGTTTSSNIPVIVTGGNKITQLSAGYNHTCSTTTTGSVLCWGQNYNAQLGNGTLTSVSAPTAVSNATTGVMAVIAGGSNTCIAPTVGGIKCFGNQTNAGETGDIKVNVMPQFVVTP